MLTRHIGILSDLTPLGSTAFLMGVSGRPLTWRMALPGTRVK